MATSSTPYPHISGISVDCSRSNKNIESAEVQLGRVKTPIRRDAGAVGTLYLMKFDIPMQLSHEDTFSLRLLHKKRRLWKGKLKIKFDTMDIVRACGENQVYEYRKTHDGIAIVVSLVGNTSTEQPASPSEESLHPTTDDIFKICPRFRILVIGKTGVGKSSLINQVFGVQDALVSNDRPGEANIETGFISPQNDKLVLHDSKGFEPGEGNNLKTVLDFIERRRNMPDLKDNLHAVWLCFEIPRAGGRLLEVGTEEFLGLKCDGQLGKIPIVVVLTKYDILLDRVDRTLEESDLVGLSHDDVKKLTKERADAELQKVCIEPLERSAGSTIPHIAVSNNEEHKDMIAHLIQITEERVNEHFATEASVMAGVAQRVNPMLNIQTSIEVGKKRYWKALASTSAFKGQTVLACLEVLHADIVRVWNFRDPHHYLESKEFKHSVVRLVDQLEVASCDGPKASMTFGLSAVAAIAGIVTVVAGSVAPIVVPIVGCVALAVWVYRMYKFSRVLLRQFIAYIVDLTIVLQMLYLVSDNEDVTRRKVKLAVGACDNWHIIADVHNEIKRYDGDLLDKLDEETLNMIEKLMNEFSLKASEIPGLKAKIPAINSQPDEPW